MDYKKKSLNKLNQNKSYEELDTRLASGWYVDSAGINKKKKYKTKVVSYKVSKKFDWPFDKSIFISNLFKRVTVSKKTKVNYFLIGSV